MFRGAMMRNQEDYTTEMTGTTYKVESGIATITLNRPNQYNTLTEQVILDLISKLDEITHDGEIKVLIIASNGKAFSTGHDLKDMLKNKLIDGIIKEPIGGAHAEPEKMYKKLKTEIKTQISELELLSSKERIVRRTEKFSNMGN